MQADNEGADVRTKKRQEPFTIERRQAMKLTDNMWRFTVAAFGLAAWAVAYAQQVPEGAIMFNFAKAKWERPSEGGNERATIYGDPTKSGPYLYVVKMPPRASSRENPRAHSHPDTRNYTVISGTWYIGFGDKYDDSKLIALPAGSYYTEPAGLPHFVTTKSDGAVVMFGGTGPTRQISVEPAPAKK
jgi:quercetin dioxygenase-like cupin family protein